MLYLKNNTFHLISETSLKLHFNFFIPIELHFVVTTMFHLIHSLHYFKCTICMERILSQHKTRKMMAYILIRSTIYVKPHSNAYEPISKGVVWLVLFPDIVCHTRFLYISCCWTPPSSFIWIINLKKAVEWSSQNVVG